MWKREIRKTCKIISVLLLVSGLTACGGEYAGTTEGEAVSGSAVSGDAVSGGVIREEAVSGGALQEEAPKDSYRFATDTNYYCDPEQGDIAIWQYRLDATKKKVIPLPHKDAYCSELICVEDGFLYYYIDLKIKGEDSPASKIFRVPVRKDKDGYDVVDMNEREEILSDEKHILTHGVYMTSRYICYLRTDWWTDEWCGRGEVVKYDRKTGRKLPVETLPMDISEEMELDDLEFAGYGDMVFVISTDEVCFQKLDETKWDKIKRKAFYYVVYNENAIFDVDGNKRYTDIYKYDLAARQWQSYISEKELSEAVNTALGSGKAEQMECRVDHMSCQGDRIYIQVIATWREGEVTHFKTLFFSKGDEDRTVCYEKELAECVRSHVTVNEGKLVDDMGDGKPVVLEDAGLRGIINGKVFLSFYDYEKKEGRPGCYELSTGAFRWLTKKDAEYYELCYGTHNDWYSHGYLPNYYLVWSSFDDILKGVFVLK